ncbi:glycosyltransferase [Kribbella italica]|uniref:UDP:flavonoid glycosyltransferase YjiC (YdhE family) n=1 Tax=Kribbella italica TaxID=1540520 RepID=A0A7W9J425_9ACTN|nr:glycosyltransferase [Kribbella italica]MBB5835219.1 UDP:flavonoid glycosyltransferase YjiC (YdhE family) [Kribbella italica]
MRALFSFTGGNGHALPLIPVARALAVRGHEVLFTCQSAMVDTVRAAGFDVVDSGGTTLMKASYRGQLVAVNREAEVRVIRDAFAGRVARERAPRIVDVGREFGAEVVVHDEVDFGAGVAAQRLGVPHASVTVLAAGGMITPGLVDEPLDRLRTELGGAPGADDFLTIAPVMPSFRGVPLPSGSLCIRPDVLEELPDEPGVDAWLADRGGRPLVYFTLGTVFHQESGDLFTRVLAGLEKLDANVVVTVGREVDPAELGERSGNVLVERFVPQRALLPRAAAVVSHGGSGTVVSALACGVPLVLLPIGADQPRNADRCEALGVGRVLDPLTVSSDEVGAAVEDVLTTAAYRVAARRLQEEAEALPGAGAAAEVLETLT